MNNPWTLDDGLKLVRGLQPNAKRYGYHMTLGGSVLNLGISSKDIDLYFLPFNNSKVAKEDPYALIEWLARMWGNYENIGANYGRDRDPQPEDLFNTGLGTPTIEGMPTVPHTLTTRRMTSVAAGQPSVVEYATNSAPTPAYPPPLASYYLNSITRESDALIEQAIFDPIPAPPNRMDGCYKYMLKFNRQGKDRIDVFIL